MNNKLLILASQSKIRSKLLNSIGVVFEVIPSKIDERQVEKRFLNLAPRALVEKIAEAKSLSVSRKHLDRWVLSADQILECDSQIIHKAKNWVEAAEHLAKLSGKTHFLHSSCILSKNEIVHFSRVFTASVTFQKISSSDILNYVNKNVEIDILSSVGSYQFEKSAIGLIDNVIGEKSTIMGLPLIFLVQKLESLKFFEF